MSDSVLTSVDVYDAASAIGLECQTILNQHGPDVLANLIPKVVSALEELEACVLYREKEDEEVKQLRSVVEDLRSDCRAQTQLKENSQKLIGRLKECVASNFKAMRTYNREILYANLVLDTTEEEVCRLARQSGQLRAHKITCLRPIDELHARRLSLERQLQSKERELSRLQSLFHKFSEMSVSSQLAEEKLPRDLVGQKEKGKASSREICPGEATLSNLTPDSDLMGDSNSLVTLEELRHAMCERNEIKCRLVELEEQLSVLQKEDAQTLEVQGPLPLEPLEKLRPGWPEKPSIHSIFRKIMERLTDAC